VVTVRIQTWCSFGQPENALKKILYCTITDSVFSDNLKISK